MKKAMFSGGVSRSGEVELIMIASGLPYELAGG